ncbi:hypothetical protein K443DRAFT_674114 [Laccaria amethystina LaAM-08-1]|uniref:Uncharacterized protein n=1 Tax=Laccaria amethystina LaAM-08-1 TaxID=1095629 RepID=A0A0C9XYQ6_9AGAR|nr:hypothetical protein K443DRAFT_674114 [Laccaria amethystina LaAM-08-1]
MRFSLLHLLCLLPGLLAEPTSSTGAATRSVPHIPPFSSSRRPHSSSTSFRTPIHTRPTSAVLSFKTTQPSIPIHTEQPLHVVHPHRSSPASIAVIFEVLAGIIAFGVIVSLTRCFYIYKKTPKRDRIAEVLNRHHLQRELAELERNPITIRRPSLREPAPPYFPRPPSYDAALTAPVSPPQQAEYEELGTTSPPHSPHFPRRSWESPPPAHAGPSYIPPIPDG